MGTFVGVGHSLQRNPAEAGKEAALKALQQAGIAVPDFVLVFATVGYNQQLLIDAVREATSGAPLAGCSGEGVITSNLVAETNFGVCVMVLSSDELRFESVCVKEIDQHTDMAGAALAAMVKPLVTEDILACLLLADGLVFNFDPFLAAFEATLGVDTPLPIFGALAADNWTLSKTYQYRNDQVFSEGICCIVMSGKGNIAWGVNHGCIPVGAKRTITRSKGNIIYEIDGMPALDALKDYLDADWSTQWNKESLNLCLGFKTPERIKGGYEEYVIRYMVGKNDEQGSVTIQSDVSDGAELWIMRRDKELIASGLQAISRQILDELGGRKPKFVLQLECVGRGKVVFRENEKLALVRELQQAIGQEVPWIGFYTYGEIGPIANCNFFHNFTAVVAAVY
jgi:hypothetical protein